MKKLIITAVFCFCAIIANAENAHAVDRHGQPVYNVNSQYFAQQEQYKYDQRQRRQDNLNMSITCGYYIAVMVFDIKPSQNIPGQIQLTTF